MLRYGLILAAAVVAVDQAVKWLVLAYFLRRGFSKEDALDLTQDKFLRVYQ